MSNEWKDRIIRGGVIAMSAVAAVACVLALIAVTVGAPAAGRASVIMLAVAAGIGLLAVILVSFPNRSRAGSRRRHRD